MSEGKVGASRGADGEALGAPATKDLKTTVCAGGGEGSNTGSSALGLVGHASPPGGSGPEHLPHLNSLPVWLVHLILRHSSIAVLPGVAGASKKLAAAVERAPDTFWKSIALQEFPAVVSRGERFRAKEPCERKDDTMYTLEPKEGERKPGLRYDKITFRNLADSSVGAEAWRLGLESCLRVGDEVGAGGGTCIITHITTTTAVVTTTTTTTTTSLPSSSTSSTSTSSASSSSSSSSRSPRQHAGQIAGVTWRGLVKQHRLSDDVGGGGARAVRMPGHSGGKVDRMKCLWSFTFRPDGDSDPVVFAAFPERLHVFDGYRLKFTIPKAVAPAFRSVHEAADAGGMPIRLDTNVYPQMEDVALVNCSDGSLCRTATAKPSGGVGGGGKPAGVLERRLAHHLVEPHREHRWQNWKDDHETGGNVGSRFGEIPLGPIRIDKTVGWNMVRMTVDKTEYELSDDWGQFDDGYGNDGDIIDEYGHRQREKTVRYVQEVNLDLDVQGDNCFLVLTARQSKSGATAFTTSEGMSPPSWEQVTLEGFESTCLLKKWALARGAGQAIVRPTWCPYQ